MRFPARASVLATLCAGCSGYGPREFITSLPVYGADPTGSYVGIAMTYLQMRPAQGLNAFPDGGIPKIERQGAFLYFCDGPRHHLTRIGILDDGSVDNEELHVIAADSAGFHFVFESTLVPHTLRAYGVTATGVFTPLAPPASAADANQTISGYCLGEVDSLTADARLRLTDTRRSP